MQTDRAFNLCGFLALINAKGRADHFANWASTDAMVPADLPNDASYQAKEVFIWPFWDPTPKGNSDQKCGNGSKTKPIYSMIISNLFARENKSV